MITTTPRRAARHQPRKKPHATAPAGADDTLWRAVIERTRAADGTFVFAVTTTGVYCRPSCPARRPHRDNVRFFATPAAAQAAGFRPCKRCHPVAATHAHGPAAAITRVCRMIEYAEEPLTLAALARAAHMSPSHLRRTFKNVTGLTPAEYAASHRAERARATLAGASTVTAAAYAAGYASNSRFYAAAQGILGMPPSTYRTGAAGEQIHYAIRPSSLGHVLIATTQTGICAVFLGDNPAALTDDLSRRFPRATITKAGADFEILAARVVAAVESPATADASLPLDLRGTAFQHRVWQALRTLPAGSTISYGALADKLGTPRAVRAVAGACGANPVAVLVPCHRVIGADGKPTGYRWGITRKKALLEKEKTPAAAEAINAPTKAIASNRKPR